MAVEIPDFDERSHGGLNADSSLLERPPILRRCRRDRQHDHERADMTMHVPDG